MKMIILIAFISVLVFDFMNEITKKNISGFKVWVRVFMIFAICYISYLF